MNPPGGIHAGNDAGNVFVEHELSALRPEAETSRGQSGSSRSTENPFSCNVCKQSYSRVDHLARHYRSRAYLSLSSSYHVVYLLTYSKTLVRSPSSVRHATKVLPVC